MSLSCKIPTNQASVSLRDETARTNTSGSGVADKVMARNSMPSAMSTPCHLESECIAGIVAFRELQGEWENLYHRCANATPFNSWDWLFSWWQSYGHGRHLRIVTFRRDGALIGVVPLYLCVERSQLGLGARVMRFVGDGSSDSDYLNWIVPPEHESECASALTDWLLAMTDWDAVVLREMPAGRALQGAIQAAANRARWLVRLEDSGCGVLELPKSLEEFLRARQSRFRTKIRSLLKKLDQGDFIFESDSDRRDLRKRLRSLFELHQSRWQDAGQAGVFGDRSKRLFYARFAPRYMRKGWLRLYSLRSEERYLAHQLCFEDRGVIYLLQEGFDVSDPSSSYGQMLRAAVVRHLIHNGTNRYDFLGGYSSHKVSWGAEEHRTFHLVVARKSPRGRAYFHAPAVRERCVSAAKKFLPARATAWLMRTFQNVAPRLDTRE
jgi:CelD/BcsL family acetyltransferase involved in cellulose biosynthesis